MMMMYHLKPRRKKSLVPLISISGSLIVLLSIHLIFPNFFVSIIATLGIPILTSKQALTQNLAGVDPFISKNALAEKNRQLQETIDGLHIAVERATLLETENAELKNLLGRNTLNRNSIVATVLARPPQTAYDVLIVDSGSELGVSIGDTVLASSIVPIGKIVEVQKNFSKVVLFSSPGESLNVIIGTSTYAVAESLGGGSFRVKIPREVTIAQGDPVAIPSIHAQFFGSVMSIDAPEGEAFKSVFFQNPVTITQVRFVEIEKHNE